MYIFCLCNEESDGKIYQKHMMFLYRLQCIDLLRLAYYLEHGVQENLQSHVHLVEAFY